MISSKELKHNKDGEDYIDGYRIVTYYEDNSYYIGEYCKTIEGFMIGLCEHDPVISDEEIPKFVSNKDLLYRSLKFDSKAISAAIFRVDGTKIEKVDRDFTNN